MRHQAIALCIVLSAAVPSSLALDAGNSTGLENFCWMLNGTAAELLQGADQTGNLTNTFFNNKRTFLLGKKRLDVPNSISTITFCSFVHFQKAMASHAIPPTAKAVLYDNEGWSFTPSDEQQDPARYMKAFGELAHRNKLIFIAAPACTIVKKMDPTVTENIYDNYIRLGLARDAARAADVYEIQAQGSVKNTTKFAQFVQQASEQARVANPKIRVFAGLSTNPNAQRVTGEELYRAVVATKQYVNGYWLNIPVGGPYCPKCGKPRPEVAVNLLQRMYR